MVTVRVIARHRVILIKRNKLPSACFQLKYKYMAPSYVAKMHTSFVSLQNFGLTSQNSPLENYKKNINYAKVFLFSIVAEDSFNLLEILHRIIEQQSFFLHLYLKTHKEYFVYLISVEFKSYRVFISENTKNAWQIYFFGLFVDRRTVVPSLTVCLNRLNLLRPLKISWLKIKIRVEFHQIKLTVLLFSATH